MEVSNDAMFLISISHQARERYKHFGKQMMVLGNTLPCDNLVTVVFLGYYLEASLTHIIEKMGEVECLKIFCDKRNLRDIGLLYKLAYYYDTHIAKTKKEERKASLKEFIKAYPYEKGNPTIFQKLDSEFPGFKDIYDFRNSISHGELDETIKRIIINYKDIKAVEGIREEAKAIVGMLVKCAHKDGHKDISKNINYEDALKNYGWSDYTPETPL
jgi:hypothetical protein